MIQKLSPSIDEGYVRPNENWVDEPVGISAQLADNVDLKLRRRSLRSRRGQFAWAVTSFVIGSMLILFQSPFRNDFLAPGPLTSNHAQLLNGHGADRCAACHTVGNDSFAQWVRNAFQPGRNVQACQSDLCMKCHQDSINEQLATKPHNVAPDLLVGISNRSEFVSASTKSNSVFGSIVDKSGDVECSTCHREHHGNSDLTRLTDQQCQTCHSEQYQSFETDHPEFTNWSLVQRQRIAFDHVSHGYKHFPAAGSNFDCKTCHFDDDFKNVKRLAPYEQACAQCHEKNIEGRIATGIRLISLPMLDLDAIKKQNFSVGTWPENASGDFDGKISDVMRFLLFSDQQAREILIARGSQFEFADFDPDSSSDVEDAVKLTWSIKRLLHDLAINGTNELRKRFDLALSRDITNHEFSILTDGLDASVFANAANAWLPTLANEIQPHQARANGPTVAQRLQSERILSYVRNQDDEWLVVNPLSKLLDKNADRNDKQQPAYDKPRTNVRTMKHDSANNHVGEQMPAQNPGKLDLANEPQLHGKLHPTDGPTQSAQQSAAPADVLAVNPLRGFGRNDFSINSTKLSGGSSNAGGSENDSMIAREFANRIEDAKQNEAIELKQSYPVIGGSNGEIFVDSTVNSGWFRDDQIFQISYRPHGHADEYLTTLMDVVAATPEADSRPSTSNFFSKMTSLASVGACNDCHTIDANSDATFRVNWQPQYRDPSIRSFTNFSHGPHLLQPELADCTSCHSMSQDLKNAHTFHHFESTEVISNFAPIKKSNCASCHREGAAGNSCTQCHDYHVGSKSLFND